MAHCPRKARSVRAEGERKDVQEMKELQEKTVEEVRPIRSRFCLDHATQIEERFRPLGTSSNRRTATPVSEAEVTPGFGIDKLEIAFDVSDVNDDRNCWRDSYEVVPTGISQSSRTYKKYLTRLDVGSDAKAELTVGVREDMFSLRKSFGKVSFNPSRLIDPEGTSLATAEQSVDAFLKLLSSIRSLVEIDREDDLDSFRVKRIDVARDFHSVNCPSETIGSLAHLPRNWNSETHLYFAHRNGATQTLMVGSPKRGLVRLYDKFAESHGKVVKGTIRWEVEAREYWAETYGGIRTVADLLTVGIVPLATNRWEWSGMGSGIVTSGNAVRTAVESNFTDRQANSFLGWLVRQGTSWPSAVSSSTFSKYRTFQRQSGLAFVEGEWTGKVISKRLDWESGLEVQNAQ